MEKQGKEWKQTRMVWYALKNRLFLQGSWTQLDWALLGAGLRHFSELFLLRDEEFEIFILQYPFVSV